MTTTNDTKLIDLGNQLATAIRFARDALDAIPEDVMGDEEQAAIDAAMAPADMVLDQIEPIKAHTFLGFMVREMAAQWSNGIAFGDPMHRR